MDDLAALMEQVRRKREATRLTQRELAEEVGVHDTTIGRLEQGTVCNPSPETIEGLKAWLERDIPAVPQDAPRCECGRWATTELRFRVGITGRGTVTMPLCKRCAADELAWRRQTRRSA